MTMTPEIRRMFLAAFLSNHTQSATRARQLRSERADSQNVVSQSHNAPLLSSPRLARFPLESDVEAKLLDVSRTRSRWV